MPGSIRPEAPPYIGVRPLVGADQGATPMSGCPRAGKLAATALPYDGGAKVATYLYRLGGWAFGHRRKVLFGWIAVLALVVAGSSAFGGAFSSKFEVPGTE